MHARARKRTGSGERDIKAPTYFWRVWESRESPEARISKEAQVQGGRIGQMRPSSKIAQELMYSYVQAGKAHGRGYMGGYRSPKENR